METFGLEPPSASDVANEERIPDSVSRVEIEIAQPSPDTAEYQLEENDEAAITSSDEALIEPPVVSAVQPSSETIDGTWVGGPWTQLVITQQENAVRGADPQMGLLQGVLKGYHVRGIWWSAESTDATYMDTDRTQRGSFMFTVDRSIQHITAEWRIEGVADWVGSTELTKHVTSEGSNELDPPETEILPPISP